MNRRLGLHAARRWAAFAAVLAWLMAATASVGEEAPAPAATNGGPANAKDGLVCGDFLESARMRPAGLKFVGCESLMIHGLPAVRARYIVAGAEAAAIEAYLGQRTEMPAMRYLCCGWETQSAKAGGPSVGRLAVDGQSYEVSMTSGETALSQRADWEKIPSFAVYVVRYDD